ncbi:ABC transporter permease [Weissella confusa]|uniref:ABC transporter permease n=1 Tax=Weissella confusa TaxID=1583 RepID=UPI000DCA334E|nr:ABC transporter permease [Weissella confusa]MBD5833130.1 peptide ABC transporter permease [Weissella confusa]MBJ7630814.1 ABC transporter permease [Weissella confusa]MBJ7635235.1 ABC transporter permease [Weissella confusa]RAT99913.1 peptide ABC transporter permease [Weissella confusa]TGE43947.1 peptide ABC transporter permease [Weissella confusa]
MEKAKKNAPTLRNALKREFKKDQVAQFALILLALITITIFIGALFVPRASFTDVNIMDQYLAPMTDGHIFGTDNGGKDIFALLLVAARNSLTIAFFVTVLILALGTIGGLVTGYFGGKFDLIFMRFIDFMTILPVMMIIIVLVTVVPNYNMWTLIVIMTLLGWFNTVRLIRARTLVETNRDYVRASKTSGTSNIKIIFREIFPNLSSLIIVEATLMFAGNIGLETSLSFLGFGLPASTPSLGTLINYATDPETMTARPWVWVPAAVVILLYTLLIMLIGQALRRVADQRQAD